ncbi:hypothetical protein BK133_23565 [Paenibacillus sp. FSL H8-0548]|uniref:hypothetical protein n=1 Tax=Paenibacillus sp. FSL H8-0548 TaxID=1920422 RepID=UPI00096E26A3|nr:hypothetical protein [Paenibacillus sp. FSL H8-0548]OMF23869.1 hypothetical protein BK133_23565 [Paenibacillus sp. FSL H8-0548]
MSIVSRLTAIGLVILLVLISPTAIAAASFEFSATASTAFDKMKGAADKTTAAKLTSQYAELQAVQKRTIEWDTKIDKLHYQNEEAVLATRKRIKEVDAEKLQKLEGAVVQAKKKYEPLFTLYNSLNQQLNIAKSYKNKTMANVLKPQVETTKAAVQIAKLDIRSKEASLKAAKSAATKSIKKLRDSLSAIDPLKVKLKASKSSISSTKKQFTTESSLLNQAVKKGNATASLSSMTRMLTYVNQINAHKQKAYVYEQQMMSIIAKVDAQLAQK